MNDEARFMVMMPLQATEVEASLPEDVHGLGPGLRLEGPRENVVALLETLLTAATEAST